MKYFWQEYISTVWSHFFLLHSGLKPTIVFSDFIMVEYVMISCNNLHCLQGSERYLSLQHGQNPSWTRTSLYGELYTVCRLILKVRSRRFLLILLIFIHFLLIFIWFVILNSIDIKCRCKFYKHFCSYKYRWIVLQSNCFDSRKQSSWFHTYHTLNCFTMDRNFKFLWVRSGYLLKYSWL